MNQDDIVEHIRNTHLRCCLTKKSGENRCSLNTRGFGDESLVMLDGSKYQKAHDYSGKLCDRIVFGHWGERRFVCAVELKGGRNVDVSEAVNQIRNGLLVAADSLLGHSIAGWYPILLFSGRLGGTGTTKLRTSQITLPTTRRNSSEVIKKDCGSSLSAILEEITPEY